MTHLNELYLILNKSLKWNKSHLKCFALIMLVIILKQTCNLSSASKALPIKCLPQSFYRRMQRFFAGHLNLATAITNTTSCAPAADRGHHI